MAGNNMKYCITLYHYKRDNNSLSGWIIMLLSAAMLSAGIAADSSRGQSCNSPQKR